MDGQQAVAGGARCQQPETLVRTLEEQLGLLTTVAGGARRAGNRLATCDRYEEDKPSRHGLLVAAGQLISSHNWSSSRNCSPGATAQRVPP
jgi:hypothetical protein